MSFSKDLALPASLADLLIARNDALRLIADARRTLEMASEVLGVHGRTLMPQCALIPEDEARIRRELDDRMWRRAFDLTGFKQLMDAKAVEVFEKSLSPSPPEFTAATIRATFIELQINADSMFRRGVFNVFKLLSDTYRTNEREPFRIGQKVVMTTMVGMSVRRGLNIKTGWGTASSRLNDLDRVFQTLDGKQFLPHTLESAMNAAFEQGAVFENENYRAKAFKNGNLHLEFKRKELLDKVNEEIAAFYSDGALPDARAA
jgi:hypothetical protein